MTDNFPGHDWQRAWCHYCGGPLAAVVIASPLDRHGAMVAPGQRWVLVTWPDAPPEYLPANVDHIIPVAHGGLNDGINTIPACQWCNASKGTRSYREFVGSR